MVSQLFVFILVFKLFILFSQACELLIFVQLNTPQCSKKKKKQKLLDQSKLITMLDEPKSELYVYII